MYLGLNSYIDILRKKMPRKTISRKKPTYNIVEDFHSLSRCSFLG